MNDAISIFYYTFSKLYNFLFNEAIITENVSIGWIFITCILFGLVINSILNIPSGLHYGNFKPDQIQDFRGHADYKNNTGHGLYRR